MLLGSASCFGLNIPYARMAAAFGVPGPDIVVLRVAVMLALLAAIAALRGRGSLRVAAGARGRLLGLSLVTAVVGLCYVSSVSFIPVGIAVLIFYTFPMLILAATPFVDRRRLSVWQVCACGLAFAGIALAIGPSLGALDWRGLVLAAMASGAAATQFFLVARAPGGGGLASMFWVHVAVLPVSLAVMLTLGGPVPLATLEAASLPVSFTVLFYIFGFALQFRGLRLTSAASAGLIYCIEPVVAVAVAAWLLGERLTLAQYLGGALVLGAVLVGLLSERKRPKAAVSEVPA